MTLSSRVARPNPLLARREAEGWVCLLSRGRPRYNSEESVAFGMSGECRYNNFVVGSKVSITMSLCLYGWRERNHFCLVETGYACIRRLEWFVSNHIIKFCLKKCFACHVQKEKCSKPRAMLKKLGQFSGNFSILFSTPFSRTSKQRWIKAWTPPMIINNWWI